MIKEKLKSYIKVTYIKIVLNSLVNIFYNEEV